MNENDISRQVGMPVRTDEPWIQRTGRDTVNRRYYFTRQAISQYFEGGVASTLMERIYKSGDDLVVEEPVVYPGVGITSKANMSNPVPGDAPQSLTVDSRNYLVQKDIGTIKDAVTYPCSMGSTETRSNPKPGDSAYTVTCKEGILVGKSIPKRKYIVRRLTPTECARLQGFPDWWTDGAEGSDSAKYKLWGNGIALPCAEDVLRRLAKELRREDDHHNRTRL